MKSSDWLKRASAGGLGIGVAAVFGVAAPHAVLAQSLPATGGIPTRDQLQGVTGETAPAPAPRLSIAGGIEHSPCPLADPQYADIKVTIGHVTFNGLKGASAEELESAWKPFAGTPQPIATLCEIRDAAGTILRNKGYLAAVQVPTQRIENGEVRMEVLYARVTAISARGETRGAERKLQEYLGQLTRNEIFDRNKAERYLLLARDLPGYNVQLTLRPAGSAPGELVGEVTVLRVPLVADLSIQNLASRATGRWGGQLRAQAFGLTGLGDATTLSYYATADFTEQHILQASHEFRPGSEGLVVGGQFTYAWTKPDIGPLPGGLELEARTLFASLYARYPLVRSQRANLWLSAGLDLANQDVDLIGPLTRDRLRVLWTRLDADAVDTSRASPAWRASGALELRQGLDILDASHGCVGAGCVGHTPLSRADGRPDATVVRAQGEFERVVGKVSFALLPRGQYAFTPLLGFEEFSGGNYTVGRGYDPGQIAGDDAVGVSLEVRGPRYAVGHGDIRVQPYVFGDVAWAWNKDVDGSDRLVSVGGGVRSELGERFRLDATLAVPLEGTRLAPARPDPRFLVTLTTRLLPWRTN
ncbi:ShlB/FhaC/HecB family hemolysin secretion/activation protein [Novosphingobium huizhouense]|uniref:ShlB/FhaC/HecB family hemolysin secretion/activation protein n=1 Tax=Novosphingobium huizhouense TaxID=2866625 RepID=UPI001CD8D2A9|nr:ShlB/FhaC/HecB family hemolysin secretion/activation protein [Novosphingobium huizhouense]